MSAGKVVQAGAAPAKALRQEHTHVHWDQGVTVRTPLVSRETEQTWDLL